MNERGELEVCMAVSNIHCGREKGASWERVWRVCIEGRRRRWVRSVWHSVRYLLRVGEKGTLGVPGIVSGIY